MIEGMSAVTLGTHEMPRAVRFYCALGFEVLHGDEQSSFTGFQAGASYLNLIAQPSERRWSWWGRVIFYVVDVDALYERALAAGYQPTTAPRDAEWGERFFHLIDPDGHELSFAGTKALLIFETIILSFSGKRYGPISATHCIICRSRKRASSGLPISMLTPFRWSIERSGQ
jgi:catechol 2,3-dioxygenase-like lactoylglutathione lyase family enzyme